MNDIKKIISDGIINKEKLVKKRYQFLGIDETQAMFISKIFKDDNYKKLSIEDLSSIFDTTIKTSEKIIKSLVSDGYVKIFYDDNNMKFNFQNLIETLIKSYWVPNDKTPLKRKIIWIKETLDITLENENEKWIKDIISNGEWLKLMIVINKISKLEDQSWPLLESLYNSLTLKEENKRSDIKELLDINWLEN